LHRNARILNPSTTGSNSFLIGCGIVVCFDLVLAILWGIVVAAIVAGTAVGGAGTGASLAIGLWLAILLLILPTLFFVLYLVEFILLIRHAKRAHGSSPSEYVTV
jgi:hypothetical protein